VDRRQPGPALATSDSAAGPWSELDHVGFRVLVRRVLVSSWLYTKLYARRIDKATPFEKKDGIIIQRAVYFGLWMDI
jgi:hypothetical protein